MAPVQAAISGLDSPKFLYMMAATTDTAIMGVPMAKYRLGTHSSGCARLFSGLLIAAESALLPHWA